jgi:DNA polymerase-1
MSRTPRRAAPRLHLIDGSGHVYRAFHALPALSTSRGLPTNAILGFAKVVSKLLREESPDHVAVVFDAPGETFRDALYAGYKESRGPMPDELRPQLPYIRRLVAALRLPVIEEPGVEADDVIGTLAAQASAAGIETVIVTGDKDMMQLVDERTTLFDTYRDRRIGVAEVQERFGVVPAQVPDILGLMGDAIDDIPGVPGIGEKTAMALVRRIGPVESILAHLEQVEESGMRGARKIRETLAREAETARLSRTLATIRRDVPIRLELPALAWPGPDRDALRALLGELEMRSLLRELGAGGEAAAVVQSEVAGAAEVASALAALGTPSGVSLVLVLDSPRATAARIERIAIAGPVDPVVVVTDPETPAVQAALAPLLGDLAVEKIGADLKAVRVALARRGLTLAGPAFDLSLASYCLNPSRADHGLAGLAEEMLGQPGDERGDAVATARAARLAHPLRAELGTQLRSHEMDRLFRDLELPLAEVLAEMELAGITLDVGELERLSAAFGATMDRLMHEIHAAAGGAFNINSPPQLREVLFDRLKLSSRGVRRGKTGLSTDVDVLTRLGRAHPLPAKILEYRALSKLKSTYVDALPTLVDARTGRLHTSFNQTVAATGRLSSSDPNLQNIPVRSEEGRRIRAAFVAAPGCRLISADYSQIELRLLAHLAEDPVLTDAFARDEDVHARTAADVFATLPPAEGRRLAKVINYGIVYGMGPARAARELGVPLAEAEAYIAGYFARYAAVRRFIDQTVAAARERGFVTTVLGRRRYLPELGARDPAVRQFAERAATNTPIQGSAADLIKLAMIAVSRRLRQAGLRAQMLIQVHDELVLEAPAGEVAQVEALVREAMETVWPLRVPLRVDVHSGANWAEVHG